MLRDGTAITADTLIEGVHFDHRLSAADVGWKAVAVSASDLGAMGASPSWMVLSLSLPSDTDPSWVRDFSIGLGLAATAFSVNLIGGDTTGSPGPKVAAITMGGPCPAPVRRNGGSAGDLLWVTGELGLGGAGWMLDDPPHEALKHLRRPNPPVAFGANMAREGLPTAMMDLSDGLAADLPRLCRASDCGAEVDPSRLPTPDALRDRQDRIALMTQGGEDYELLFASTAEAEADIRSLAAASGVQATVIGLLTTGSTLILGGKPWPAPTFQHFRSER